MYYYYHVLLLSCSIHSFLHLPSGFAGVDALRCYPGFFQFGHDFSYAFAELCCILNLVGGVHETPHTAATAVKQMFVLGPNGVKCCALEQHMVFIVHKGSDDGMLGGRVFRASSAGATNAFPVTPPDISVGFEYRVAEPETCNCTFQAKRQLLFEVARRLKTEQLRMGAGACGAHPCSINTMLALSALGASWFAYMGIHGSSKLGFSCCLDSSYIYRFIL